MVFTVRVDFQRLLEATQAAADRTRNSGVAGNFSLKDRPLESIDKNAVVPDNDPEVGLGKPQIAQPELSEPGIMDVSRPS